MVNPGFDKHKVLYVSYGSEVASSFKPFKEELGLIFAIISFATIVYHIKCW
jgi:hypothetical protein